VIFSEDVFLKKKPHCHVLFTAVGVPLKGVLRAGAIRYWRIEEGNALILPEEIEPHSTQNFIINIRCYHINP
jgi:hypothetical protein